MGSAKKPTTHVLAVADMSGSMARLAPEVRGGFNKFIEKLREDGGRYRVTATVFDTNFVSLCVAAKLRDVPEMTEANYQPLGMTALLDAVGKTITEFEAATTLGEGDRVMLVVQTDGAENSSQEFTAGQIAEMLAERQKAGWLCTFMGAGPDAWGQGKALGFASNVNTANSARGTLDSYAGVAVAAAGVSRGMSADKVHETLERAAGVSGA